MEKVNEGFWVTRNRVPNHNTYDPDSLEDIYPLLAVCQMPDHHTPDNFIAGVTAKNVPE